MAARRPPKGIDARNAVSAGAAGGSVGTILALCANLITDDWSKQLVTLSIPTVSIAISATLLFVKEVYVDPFVSGKKHAIADAAMERILTEAKAIAESVLNDPDATDQHKKAVRKMVEDLEAAKLKRISERMEVIE